MLIGWEKLKIRFGNRATKSGSANYVKKSGSKPYREPFSEYCSEPVSEPYREHFSGPYSEPFSGPYSDPFSGPYCEPFSGPFSEPFSGPYSELFSGNANGLVKVIKENHSFRKGLVVEYFRNYSHIRLLSLDYSEQKILLECS